MPLGGEGFRAIYRRAVKRAEQLVVGDARDIPAAKGLLYALVYMPIAYALVFSIVSRAGGGFSNAVTNHAWAVPLFFILSIALPAGLPWAVAFPLARDEDYVLYEYACHEGNYAMTHILSAARAAERAAK